MSGKAAMGNVATEALDGIENEWQLKPIRELASIRTGPFGTLLKASEYSGHGVPLISVGEIGDGIFRVSEDTPRVPIAVVRRLPQYVLRVGDIVLGRKGAVERSALVTAEQQGWFLGSDGICVRPERCHAPYLAFQLRSKPVQEWLLQNAVGTTMASLNQEILGRAMIPVATCIEQKAIAAVLGDVDALLGALDGLIAKKRDLKQAAIQQLLTGQIRLPGFTSTAGQHQTDAGTIPVEWQARPLLSAVRLAEGQVDPRVDPFRSMTLVAPDHIESATGRLLSRQSAAVQGAVSGKYRFAAGDVLYSKIRPYLRKATVADFDGLCSADMYPLKPAAGVSARYILAVLLGHRFSTYAESVSARSGMPKINREELAAFNVALPTASEQDAIASVLSDMDADIAALEDRRNKTRLLKQGMMQELLTGRTRLV